MLIIVVLREDDTGGGRRIFLKALRGPERAGQHHCFQAIDLIVLLFSKKPAARRIYPYNEG